MGAVKAVALLALAFSTLACAEDRSFALATKLVCTPSPTLSMVLQNKSDQEVAIDTAFLPWSLNSPSLHLTATVFENDSLSPLRGDAPIADYFGFTKIAPHGSISGQLNLFGQVPELRHMSSKHRIIFWEFDESALRMKSDTGDSRLTGVIFLPAAGWLWNTGCGALETFPKSAKPK